jgi:hypothetical protein
MKGWLLILVTTLLVHLIAHMEVLSGEVAFTPHLAHLLRTNEPVFSSRELATPGRSKAKVKVGQQALSRLFRSTQYRVVKRPRLC